MTRALEGFFGKFEERRNFSQLPLHYATRMHIPPFPLAVTDWSSIAPTEHTGETGVAWWRTQNFGDIRFRLVEYSPG
ncbi:hypothetical protein Acid345_4252 [Candidatus Koribacter versatilis Ellin345]|uniref:Uncharacterized protein n=1 Tax=Koribacter versatilis (strain Ellin345) TaxID=204669 RepID=Q1IIP8_KORVE|nr:hypothetical protein Acid345_4252 [Candidatus Koribacter versatilis Ellin345]